MHMARNAVIIVGVVLASSSGGWAQGANRHPALEADVETFYKMASGKVIHSTGHYYRDGAGRSVDETSGSSVIVDLPQHTVTMLNFPARTARVFSVGGAATAARTTQPSDWKDAGLGVHEGHQVAKSRRTGARGETEELWTAPDIGLIVMTRTESAKFTMTKFLRNIHVHQPDLTIFAIPSGFSVTRSSADGSR